MDRIFNYDNKFFRGVNKALDCVIASVCWLIMCIPVFTIGASCAALYDTVHRVIHRGRGYVWNNYWSAFKSNFKQATKAWIIQLIVILILVGDIYITSTALRAGEAWGALYFAFLVLAFVVAAWVLYTYAYIARFEQTTKNTLRNAILLAIGNLPWTVVILILAVGALLLMYVVPFFAVIIPGLVGILYEKIFERIFRKLMTPEELEREKEEDYQDMTR